MPFVADNLALPIKRTWAVTVSMCHQKEIKQDILIYYLFSVHHLQILLLGLALQYATNKRTKKNTTCNWYLHSSILLQMLEQSCAIVHESYKCSSCNGEQKNAALYLGPLLAHNDTLNLQKNSTEETP